MAEVIPFPKPPRFGSPAFTEASARVVLRGLVVSGAIRLRYIGPPVVFTRERR